jgi:tripartite-type tricarboxylate transporter receptor subunit TctC
MRILLSLAIVFFTQVANAAFPDQPIRLIVPWPAGGASDTLARIVSLEASKILKQPIVIDNRVGASGTIGTEHVAREKADGYTLLWAIANHATNHELFKVKYDPVKDFTPIALTHVAPRVLVVHPSLPATSVKELIAHAKAKPGALTFGSSGNGGINHLSGELFKTMAGVDMLHVPYKGAAPAAVDLLGGRLSMVFDSIVVWSEHMKSGKVRALGVSGAARSAALPNVPTIAEAGLPGFETANWLGVLAPARTPPEVISRLSAELKVAMADAEMRQLLIGLGVDPMYSTPQEFAEIIRKDIVKWAAVVKATGAKLD